MILQVFKVPGAECCLQTSLCEVTRISKTKKCTWQSMSLELKIKSS